MGAGLTASLLVLLTALSYAVGWAIAIPALVPWLNTLASFPFMVAALRRGQVRLAIARMLLWALTLAVCATLLSYFAPARTDVLFLRGASYRTEMFAWVLTGQGAESTPSLFLPQQAMHTSIFVLLALGSGSVLAMPMGAVLMNYMGHYVGSLAAASARPALTMALGWHPWAIIRIASFVTLGVVLSTPLLGRLARFTIDRSALRAPLIWACAGLGADVVMKWLLAPAWQRLLLRVVGW
ncbi:MAG TPA: hypothetical protein VHU82_00015 [Vicinamibacterales bacterium]|nr:hypothetical protein [Vicinamibacterales bacterium]